MCCAPSCFATPRSQRELLVTACASCKQRSERQNGLVLRSCAAAKIPAAASVALGLQKAAPHPEGMYDKMVIRAKASRCPILRQCPTGQAVRTFLISPDGRCAEVETSTCCKQSSRFSRTTGLSAQNRFVHEVPTCTIPCLRGRPASACSVEVFPARAGPTNPSLAHRGWCVPLA